MNKTANVDRERFRSGAQKYADYLETPEGRLRLDLAFANLEAFLPSRSPVSVLDMGCGTGATAIRLARLGAHVTLVDSSVEMLEIAQQAVAEAAVAGTTRVLHGDVTQTVQELSGQLFDLVLCHNVLEYLESPGDVMRGTIRLMRRDPPALLSLLVRNRAGEVLKAAIQAGDLDSAEQAIDAGWGRESLYGGPVRLFTTDEILAISKEAKIEIIAERGVRVISDYLPRQVSREAEYQRIFELERKLGQRPEFTAVARYTHYLARCPAMASEAGA